MLHPEGVQSWCYIFSIHWKTYIDQKIQLRLEVRCYPSSRTHKVDNLRLRTPKKTLRGRATKLAQGVTGTLSPDHRRAYLGDWCRPSSREWSAHHGGSTQPLYPSRNPSLPAIDSLHANGQCWDSGGWDVGGGGVH